MKHTPTVEPESMYPETAVFKSTRPSGSDNAEPNSTEHSMLFLHQKIRATRYSRTVYTEKWQSPPSPISVKLRPRGDLETSLTRNRLGNQSDNHTMRRVLIGYLNAYGGVMLLFPA